MSARVRFPYIPSAADRRKPVANAVVREVLDELEAAGDALTSEAFGDAFDRALTAVRDEPEGERARLLGLVMDHGARVGCMRE